MSFAVVRRIPYFFLCPHLLVQGLKQTQPWFAELKGKEKLLTKKIQLISNLIKIFTA